MQQQPPGDPGSFPQPPKEGRNVLALVALIVAAVGFIFACIPGALILGWILLPIAFILSIVSLFLKGRGKALGVIGLVVSVVGTVVGFIVFFAVVSTAFDDAFNDGDVTVVEQPTEETDEVSEEEEEPAAAEAGTRANPHALGTTISNDEWEVTINSVTFDAGDAVEAENQFNEPAPEGSEYVLINATITYVGDDEEGGIPAFVGIEYVTATGETVDTLDSFAVAPDALDSMSTLYNGGTASGNIAIAVPSENAESGVIAVSPGMLADTVFYAVQ